MKILPSLIALFVSAPLALAQTPFFVQGILSQQTFNDTTVSLVSESVTRTALLHIPKGYTSGASYPLVILFHGEEGTSAGFESNTGFSAVADTGHFFAVYPETNPSGGQWTTTATGADIVFINALIAQLEASYNINPSKIFAVGFSNGGGMARTMTCNSSPALAGMADISEEMSTSVSNACTSPQQIPMLNIHGTCDPVSPYEYGETAVSDAPVWSMQATIEFWLAALGCVGGSAVWNPIAAQPLNGTVLASQQPVGCPYGADNPMSVSVTSADGVISFPTAGSDIALLADTVMYEDSTTVSTTDIVQTWGAYGVSTCAGNSHLTAVTIPYGGHQFPGNYPPGNNLGFSSENYNAAAIWAAINH